MSDRNWKEVKLEDSSDVWDKEKPLEGQLKEVEENVGPNKSKMYTITTNDGEVKVWGSTVLDDKLMGVPKGSYVKLEYEGKLTSKKGTQYHSYKVFVDIEAGPQESEAEIESQLDRDSLDAMGTIFDN